MDCKNIILDSGSGHTKMGWSNQTIPEASYPSVVGRPLLRSNTVVDGVIIKVKIKFNFPGCHGRPRCPQGPVCA